LSDPEKLKKGMEFAQKLFPDAQASGDLPPQFLGYMVGHLFGDVWQGDGLSRLGRGLAGRGL